ncbi:MAG TPA: NADH-ubiquinone oxidoreductase-F iron-sulfur binding region domain-containing protein [Acidimicrobiales bacterium]|nr:NADH-ubiquinone oxidoreductase-F iron-sulfur binding region domain-containing protein [Acidimicrobiales bacterium]
MTLIDIPRTVAQLLAPAPDLATHLAVHGPTPAIGTALIPAAHAADVRGRGGAGFPTARKLAAVAAAAAGRRATVVVANGTEGEPLSGKDKALLTLSPHLVLDGLDAAAGAVGATRRIVCIERGNRAVGAAVAAALAERGDPGVEVVTTPRRYVAGQETALVDLIDGGAGRPTLRRPSERGVGGRATLVDNVETLAHLALVARHGPEVALPALVTVGGAVTRPGVQEVATGEPLAAVLDRAGARRPRAVLVGGYSGRWVPAATALRLRLDPASLAAAGTGMGCGAIAVVDDDSCAVVELARVAEWFARSSAGQCGACTWGLRDMADATGAVHAGTRAPAAPADIRRWAAMVRGRGACKLPDGAAGFLGSGIDVFAEEAAEHQAGRCRRADAGLLPVPTPEAFR